MKKYILYILLVSGQVFFAQINEKNQEQFELAFFNAMNERLKENYNKSNDYFQQCLTIDNTNDAIYFKMAQNYYKQKNFDKALFYLTKAQKINPDNKWFQKLFIEIKIDQGAANNEIIKLINEYKPVAKNKYITANLFRKLYKRKITVNYDTPAKKRTPATITNQWENLWQAKKYPEIITKGEQILMENPADADTYLYMAKAKFALNKISGALEYLDMGIDFVQQNKKLRKQYYELYIKIYQKKKNTKKAEKYRQKLNKI